MSAELDGAIEFIGDLARGAVAATGAAIRGVAAGVAFLGTAAFNGAAALAKMSVSAAKAVGETTAEAFKEMQELQKIVAEEKRRQREAYAEYVQSLEADKSRRNGYLKKLEGMVEYEALGIDGPAKDKISKLSERERIEVFNNLINLQSRFGDISNLFFRLSDFGVETECEYEFYKIKKQLEESVRDGNYNFDKIFGELDGLLSELRKLQTSAENAEVAEFIEAQLFQIENELGSPLLTEFCAELYEMLRLPKEESETDGDRLFAVEKEVLRLAQLFSDFNYEFEEKAELKTLLSSIRAIVTSDDSAETKLKLLDRRYHRMSDVYQKVSVRHGEVLKLKERYNEAISVNYNLREYLSLALPQFAFDYRTAEAEIRRLNAENGELAKKAQEKQKREYVRKALRETMREMQFEYLCSQTAATASGEAVETDVFHIQDGNVVSVTLVKGRVCCSVSGVKLAGVAEDKGSVVNSMKKFCSKRRQLQEKLRERGVALEFDEEIEPDEIYAREITLKGASASATETIRKAKLKIGGSGAAAKKKTIN